MRNISNKMRHSLGERIASKVKCNFFILFVVAALAAFLCSPAVGQTITPVLGSAQNFAVLGHTGVSNTGPTVVFGSASVLANVGNYQDPGDNAISGFNTAGNTFVGTGSFTDGPGLVNAPAKIYGKDGVSLQARNDLIAAYAALWPLGMAKDNTPADLTGKDLGDYHAGAGGLGALAPGVYHFDSSVGITGVLQLDAQNTDGVYWVFQIGSTLDTAAGANASTVELINPGGNLGSDVGVFWVVGSSATIGTYSKFEGNILALTDITVNTGATIYNGRALARNGAVTLDTNVISDICPAASSSPNSGPGFSGGLGFDTTGKLVEIASGQSVPTPEPATMLLLGLGLMGLAGVRRKIH